MFRLDPFTSVKSARQSGASRFGRTLPLITALCLSLSSLAACGGDDSDNSPAPTAGKGGAGGAAAGSGAGGAGSNALPPIPPVPCGSTMCVAPTSALSGIASMFGGGALAGLLPRPAGCCLDEAASTCGITTAMSGGTCEAKATPDKRCPAANLGMLGPLLGASSSSGCCIDNKCGQDGAIFGRGCVDNAEAAGMLMGLPLGAAGGGMMGFPAPQACDAPPKPSTDTDGGVTDLDAGM